MGGYFDQLVIGGSATLDGTLNVILLNNFGPTSGDVFVLMTFAALNGTFASTGLDPSFGSMPSYDPTDITVQAI